MRQILFTTCLFFALSDTATAQDIDRDAFLQTREVVSKLGPMRDSSLRGIVNGITRSCNTPACSMYGIYLWTAQYISLDCSSQRHPEKENNSASYVLRTREANSFGFANLISEMCRLINIHCEVVTGLAKREVDDISNVDNEADAAAWNIVEVGNRRYVLDASIGSGVCDGKHFTKQLTDAYYLCNRTLFALSHFPKDKRQQLLDTPIERAEFVAAPIVAPMAFVIPLVPPKGLRGLVRGRDGDTVWILFNAMSAKNAERVGTVAVYTDGRITPVPFSKSGSLINVGITLPQEGKYPLTLLINNAPALTFQVQAAAAPKRRPAAK